VIVTRFRRARDRRHGDEAGTSLVELMVVTIILGLVMAVALGGLVSAQNADQGNAERVGNIDQARQLMDNTTKDLHRAVRIVAGGSTFLIAAPREVEFTATLDAVSTDAPVQIHLYVDTNSQLVEQTRVPDNSVATAAPPYYTYTGAWTTRYVARFINNSPTQPIFSFCDSTANACTAAAPSIGWPTSCSPTAPICPLAAAGDFQKIHSVVVDFSVRHSTVFTVNASRLTTRVRLPNLDYNGTGGLF
jgi:type II secretory pathway pseudopilin PulG